MAAPGTHPAGTLRLEVTAIDNSIYGYTIPEQVVLRPNRHYTKSYELSLDEFVLSDEFEAEIPVLSCKVGEPLTVSMTASPTAWTSGRARRATTTPMRKKTGCRSPI